MSEDPQHQDTIAGNCSICGRPRVEAYKPFCSKRCSDVDLARWLRGSYTITGGPIEADEDGDDGRSVETTDTSSSDRT